MQKLQKIQFDMSETDELDTVLVNIKKDFYVKPTRVVKGNSIRFAIPKQIVGELNLKASDPCFFVKFSEGFYISFNHEPDTVKRNYKKRLLQGIGQYKTLYLVIPPMIQSLYKEQIKYVKLIRTEGFKNYEWQIQFLSTDFT